MARRVVLGKVGSEFVFRVSRPGFDAASTDLSNLIFDADGVQARVAAAGLATVAASDYPLTPATTTIAHGVAAPGLAIGVAQSLFTDVQGTNNGMWVGQKRQNDIFGGQVQSVPLDWNEDLKIGWCTPWRLEARHDPDGYLEANGWRIRWNNTSLFLDNFQRYGIRVRWAVLEF